MSGAAPVLALAAGGTGGHMFPAQALAEEARARGWSVLLLTDARGMRFADGFPADEIVELRAANPNVRGPAAKIGMAWAMAGGTRQAGRSLRAARPFATVGFGGYPSAPAMFAAKAARLRHGIHEQNAVLGRVNRRVAPSADFVAHGFARLDRLGRVRGEVVQTGNPVRRAVRDAARPMDAIGDHANILVFGGSQGASLFSRVFPAALARLPAEVRARLRVTQQVREDEVDAVAATYRAAGIPADLAPFFADLPARMADSHLVIGRSGASSVTELSVIGRGSLLVPLGIAMDDHQRANAEVLAAAGAARLIEERALSIESAAAALSDLLVGDCPLPAMAEAARGLVPDDAAVRLADRCASLLEAAA